MTARTQPDNVGGPSNRGDDMDCTCGAGRWATWHLGSCAIAQEERRAERVTTWADQATEED